MTFPESLETHRRAFLESLRVRSYSPATQASYGRSLSVFFRFLSSRAVDDVREVSRQTVAEYQARLKTQSFTTWTQHAYLQAVRRFFEHLEKTDAILINPCADLRLPTLEDRLPRTILTPEEARAILNAPNTQKKVGIRDRAMLELFYSTGIRREEMTRLTIHDPDLQNGFLRVNKGKFAKDRVVPMGTRAVRWLREYLRNVRLPWSKAKTEERALWLSAQGKHPPICHQTIGVMIRKYAKAAGITRAVTPHVWRHTCATHLVANGANIAHVQRLLGHRSLQTTQIYTRVTIPEVKATHARAHPRA
jgi:integrase/recombinase XerD